MFYIPVIPNDTDMSKGRALIYIKTGHKTVAV